MKEEVYIRAVQNYLDDVYRLAYSISNNAADAADIAQNVFLKLSMHMKKASFESEAHLKNWLLKCAANESRSLLRTFWKRRVQPADETDFLEMESREQTGDTARIRSLIGRLSRTDRAIVVLFYWYGYDQKEIAGMLKMSASAVSTRLYRIRGRLKNMLMEEEEEDERSRKECLS